MDDTERLRRLIVKLTGCIAEDEDGCAYTGRAGDLVRAVESVVDAFAVFIPDPDEAGKS